MAADIAQLSVRITADTKAAESGIKNIDDKVKGASTWKGILGNALSFAGAQIGINTVGDALGFVKNQLGDMIQSGLDANQMTAQLTAGLKSTGGASGQTLESLDGLSNSIMNLTGIDDDAVKSAESMLLTFTGVKGNFNAATQATADLATKMAGGAVPSSQQMQEAAMQLGKALNDLDYNRLIKQGVTFSDSQKQQLDQMKKNGDVAGGQKIILAELNKEFGHSAEAAGQANGGMAIMTAQINNAKQNIGQTIDKALIPLAQAALPAVRDALNGVNNLLQGAIKMWNEHKDIIGPVAAIIGGALVAAFVAWAISAGAAAVATIAATWPILAIGAAIAGLVVGFKLAYDHIGPFHAAIDGLVAVVKNVIGVISDLAGKISGLFKSAASEAAIHTAEMKDKSITNTLKMQEGTLANTEKMRQSLVEQIKNTKDPVVKHMLEMKLKSVEHTEEMQKKAVDHTKKLKEAADAHLADMKKNAIQHFADMVGNTVSQAGQWALNVIVKAGQLKDQFLGKLGELKDQAVQKFNELKNNVMNALADWPNKLRDMGVNLIQKIIDGVKSMGGALTGALGDLIRNALHNIILPGGGHLPGFASGGILPNGLAIVGENGPELMAAPGARIYSASETANLMRAPASASASSGGGGSGRTQHIVVQLDRRTIAEAVVEEMPDIVRVGTGIKLW